MNKSLQLILSSVICFIAGAGLTYLLLAPDSNQKEDLKQFRKTIQFKADENIKSSMRSSPSINKQAEPSRVVVQPKSELMMTQKEYVELKKKLEDHEDRIFRMTNSFFNKANPDDPVWKSILQDRLQRADNYIKNGNSLFKSTYKFSNETLIYVFAEYIHEKGKIQYRINYFYVDHGIIEGEAFSYDVSSALLIDNELYMEVSIRYSTLFDESGVTTLFLPLPDSNENAYILKIKDRKLVRTKEQLIEWVPSNKKEEETFFNYMIEKYHTPTNNRGAKI